jgi:hypothetical protein
MLIVLSTINIPSRSLYSPQKSFNFIAKYLPSPLRRYAHLLKLWHHCQVTAVTPPRQAPRRVPLLHLAIGLHFFIVLSYDILGICSMWLGFSCMSLDFAQCS